MRVLFEEMVLDAPGGMKAQPIGEFNLLQTLLEGLEFDPGFPWTGNLKFRKD